LKGEVFFAEIFFIFLFQTKKTCPAVAKRRLRQIARPMGREYPYNNKLIQQAAFSLQKNIIFC
jgi:hypothetical protein